MTTNREGLVADVEAGGSRTPVSRETVARLQDIVRRSGPDVALPGRYSVVFVFPGMGVGRVYPDLAGCTTEVCAFIEESTVFEKHGIQVVGLSTEPSEPPPGCIAIPFPVGVLPGDAGEPIVFAEKDDRRFAVRATFLVYPDGTGERISEISDVVAHVHRCFEIVNARRLARFRDAALERLHTTPSPPQASMSLTGLLPNGADSVAIARLDLRLDLVAKMGDAAIIAQEAGYIERINALLAEAGREPIFPRVLGVCTDEDPAWYLMEAADPRPLDLIAFSDARRTTLSDHGRRMIERALAKVSALHELTFRAEVAEVSRYHYDGRFAAIRQRDDFRDTFAALVADADLPQTLGTAVELADGTLCRPFDEQLSFLSNHAPALCEPAGAYLHGDLHLPNMLLSSDGEDVTLIDPRVVWDGHDLGDPGFCDPLYDLATLLHSLHVMSPTLRAIEAGESHVLVDIQRSGDRIVVRDGILTIAGNPVESAFMGWVERTVPPRILQRRWRARLHIGAANALLGWLKYARSIQTAGAWHAVFVATLYHLEMGRRALEEDAS